MRFARALIPMVGAVCVLAACAAAPEIVDESLSLADAKEYTQTMEREIAGALPAQFVESVKQKDTGVFLPCSRDGGEQWAGGLTAQVQVGVEAATVLDPVQEHFSSDDVIAVNRRRDEEDSLLEISGPHRSAWIVRYDPDRGEVYLTSFSPCIRLPADVWRGDKY